jgi:quinol monooxygenase YgiN
MNPEISPNTIAEGCSPATAGILSSFTAMSEPFGMQARFTAQPGKGEAFAELLLEAAKGLEARAACLLYVVNLDVEEPDVVCVTEAWTTQAEHAASLQDPAARALIERALPLLAGPPEARQLHPVGGKGLRLP